MPWRAPVAMVWASAALDGPRPASSAGNSQPAARRHGGGVVMV